MEERGFKFRETESIFLSDPFIEENEDRVKIPLFRWIGASFLLEGPKEIISNWLHKEGDIYEINPGLFKDWMDDNHIWGFQDGCGYAFGQVAYDLENFGTHCCNIDKYFIEDFFNNLEI